MTRHRLGSIGWLAGLAVLAAWLPGLVPLAGQAVPSAGPAAAARPPDRIVSLNLCTDQILLDLVPRERIAGLSELVADPTLSGRVDAARGIPLLRGHAEEVLARAPDVVIAGDTSTPATLDLLERLGVRVVRVPTAMDFDGIRAKIRAVAAAAGAEAQGAAMVARFDARLATLTPRAAWGGPAPSVVVYQLNSLASGAGTMLDAIVRAAGLRNAAHELPLGPAGRLPLETLALDAPDMIVVTAHPDAYRTTTADNLRHPAFRALLARRQSVMLPMPLWMCGTPDVLDAVERLVAAHPVPLALREGGR